MYYLFAISVLINLVIAFFLYRTINKVSEEVYESDTNLTSKIDYVEGLVENLPEQTEFDQVTMEFDEFKEEIRTSLSESLENA